MTDKQRLLLTDSIACADPNRTGSQPVVSKVRKSSTRRNKGQDADEFLEETLVNNRYLVESLTRRETEVLNLIISGKTNRQIAKMLCRTERTVEYHRNRMMRKLGAHNAADLVRRAIYMEIA